MKSFNWRIPIGLALVVLGALAFLQSFNIITFNGSPWAGAMAVLFAFIGGVFLYSLITDHNNWWTAIPGLTLIGLGVLIGLALIPGFSGNFGAFIFMGSIAASFWVIYAMKREFWWAIIPGGTLTSVALLILLSDNGVLGASVLFLGMAATFGVLGLIPVNGRKMSWPWIPAAALAILGGIVAGSEGGVPAIVWAILVILVGLFLVVRPIIQKNVR
jgi:hypothetical protein